MHRSFFTVFLLSLTLHSCQQTPKQCVWNDFPPVSSLIRLEEEIFEKDSIAVIEGLECDGKNLVVSDVYEGKCYTLFDASTGAYIGRFGSIGQGPGEIENLCSGHLSDGCFSIFSGQTGRIQKYFMDSLRLGHQNASPIHLFTYNLPDLSAFGLSVLNDSTFLAAGTYLSRYQYCLFNDRNEVLDSAVEIYNAADSSFNNYIRPLTNQGVMAVHPTEKERFAYALWYSSNIDFMKVTKHHIDVIRKNHYGNPEIKPLTLSMGGTVGYSFEPNKESPVGFLDLAASVQGVYALYSDKAFKDSRRESRHVLFWDWEGNPIGNYQLDTDVYHIAVTPEGKKLFAATKSEEGEWIIACYDISQ